MRNTTEKVSIVSQSKGVPLNASAYLKRVLKYGISRALDVKLRKEIKEAAKPNDKYVFMDVSHVTKGSTLIG